MPKNPPLVPLLCQIRPVYGFSSYSNVTLPYHLWLGLPISLLRLSSPKLFIYLCKCQKSCQFYRSFDGLADPDVPFAFTQSGGVSVKRLLCPWRQGGLGETLQAGDALRKVGLSGRLAGRPDGTGRKLAGLTARY